MIKQLAKSIREFKRPTVFTLILIVCESLIETCIPFFTADLINVIERGGADVSSILKTGGILVALAITSLACGGLAGFTCSKASAGFARNLRGDIYRKVQTFSFENIDRFSSASLVTRMTTDVNNVQITFMMLIRIAIRAPLLLIFSTVMAFVKGGSLAWSFAIIIPVLAFGLVLIGKAALPAFRRVFKKYDLLNESIEENVRGMRVVKGFAREEYEKQKLGVSSDNIRKDFTKAERIVAFGNPLMNLCMYVNTVFILWIGAKLIISSNGVSLNVGDMQALLTYGMQVLMSLMMLSMIYVMLTMTTESARRINEVLVEEPVLKNPTDPVTTVKDGSVEFDRVNFKYSASAKKYALADVNVKIESGMTVGIIGGTGSGKSSLVQLIPRLYDVTEGSLKVGGEDVRNYDVVSLRNSVAMVLQKNLLFSGTIKDNLRWGNEEATDEEMIAACKLAQADDFVRSFPDGYDTVIEQGGTNVSGGQKQRLCIARALLKKPKILILDDSTSAVDTKTDALIRNGFKEFIPETTKIIIAQRIASVQDADLILVMNNGRIEAVGKHDELLSSCEIYKEVYDQQVNGGDNEQE
ncbi:MAG: ABC transporter ATP-binding protein [Christensenellales bacterium]